MLLELYLFDTGGKTGPSRGRGGRVSLFQVPLFDDIIHAHGEAKMALKREGNELQCN